MTARTSLVAMTHASNVLGTVQPIAAIATTVRDHGALFLVDAAQSAGVVPIDLRVTPIDFLAFPGHKALYGPTGTGVLMLAREQTEWFAPGGKVEPAATRRAHTAGGPSIFPRGRNTQRPRHRRPGRRNRLGSRTRTRLPGQHEVELLQHVVDWAHDAEGWKVAGRWDPETHVARSP